MDVLPRLQRLELLLFFLLSFFYFIFFHRLPSPSSCSALRTERKQVHPHARAHFHENAPHRRLTLAHYSA